MKKLAVSIGLLLIVIAASRAFGAVLMPTPQKMISQDKALPLKADSIYASASLRDADPRVRDALLEVFPGLTMTDSDFGSLPAGSTLIRVTIEEGAPPKVPECELLQCPKEGRGYQSYFLGINEVRGNNLIKIAAEEAHGAFYAVKTLKQLVAADSLPTVAIYDFPEFEGRGVLEGFYGKAWKGEKRLAMMNWMADYKFNHYLYAPKDDHMIRMSWRNKYSKKQLEEIRVTNETALKNFIQYCWELSPGISINFGREKDYRITLKKFRSVIAQGVTCVVLAFDDVSPVLTPYDRDRFGTYREAQVGFSNRLIADLLADSPDLRVAFVPNDYWGNLAPKSEYLRYVGRHLDERYYIGWTGDKIIPETVIPSDARHYEYYIGRKPILGDNYPVTDNVTRGGRISLGPLRGRDPRLHRYIEGYSANAMPIPFTSKPAFLTIADYTWNPYAYDHETSWVNSWKCLAGEENYEPFLFFAKQNESSFIWDREALELTEAIRSLWMAWDKTPDYDFDTAAAALEKLLKRFSTIDKELDAAKNDETAAILEEMQLWVDKLADYGEVGLKALALLREKQAGKEVAEEKIVEVEDLAAGAEKNKAVVAKVIMPNFFARAAALLRGEELPEEMPFKTIMIQE